MPTDAVSIIRVDDDALLSSCLGAGPIGDVVVWRLQALIERRIEFAGACYLSLLRRCGAEGDEGEDS